MKLSTDIPTIETAALDAFLAANHSDPFSILGMHQAGDDLVVPVFRRDARAVSGRGAGREFPAVLVHPDGFFEARLTDATERFTYELAFTSHDGHEWAEHDPYSFGVILGQLDLHLFGEGQHWQLYEKLGAHLTEIGGVHGTAFHVWAPNAQR